MGSELIQIANTYLYETCEKLVGCNPDIVICDQPVEEAHIIIGSKGNQHTQAYVHPENIHLLPVVLQKVTRALQLERDIQVADQLFNLSESRYRRIFEEAETGIILLAKNGKIIDINPSLQNLLEISKTEAMGKQITQILHEGVAPFLQHNNLKTKGLSVQINAKTLYLEIKGKKYTEGTREVLQWNIQDITQEIIDTHSLKGIVARLEKSEERFKLLTDLVPTPIIVTEIHSGRTEFANRKLLELTQSSIEEINSNYFYDFFEELTPSVNLLEIVKECGVALDHQLRVRKTNEVVIVNSELSSYHSDIAACSIFG